MQLELKHINEWRLRPQRLASGKTWDGKTKFLEIAPAGDIHILVGETQAAVVATDNDEALVITAVALYNQL